MMFMIGQKVRVPGGRYRHEGAFIGEVVGYSMWRDYKALNVRKPNGQVVQCLEKNATVVEEDA